MKDPILITGAARSGTSIIAGVIHKCGAAGGFLNGATKYNQKGMFENQVIRDKIVKPYLQKMNVDVLGQKPLPDIENLLLYDDLRQDVIKVMEKQRVGMDGDWFYKGAKMCLIYPIFHKAFPNAKWIIVRRQDKDIINSCMKTGFMNRYKLESGWWKWLLEHKKRFEEMKNDKEMFVQEVYPTKIINKDLSEIKKVVKNIGLEWNKDKVKEYIEPRIWHGK